MNDLNILKERGRQMIKNENLDKLIEFVKSLEVTEVEELNETIYCGPKQN